VTRACSERRRRQRVLSALQARSADDVFRDLKVDPQTFCELPTNAKETQLAHNRTAQMMADRLQKAEDLSPGATMERLGGSGAPRPETGLTSNAQLFATLNSDPDQLCRMRQDDLAAVLASNSGAQEIGRRYAQALVQEVNAQIVPALDVAAAGAARCRA